LLASIAMLEQRHHGVLHQCGLPRLAAMGFRRREHRLRRRSRLQRAVDHDAAIEPEHLPRFASESQRRRQRHRDLNVPVVHRKLTAFGERSRRRHERDLPSDARDDDKLLGPGHEYMQRHPDGEQQRRGGHGYLPPPSAPTPFAAPSSIPNGQSAIPVTPAARSAARPTPSSPSVRLSPAPTATGCGSQVSARRLPTVGM